ncbi:TonB-dependent receptor [Thalassospira lucentensis MCCC 1A00383 = DSM 14000]|nr:TonB-dependent receptor [Thalassospira lucentensis MCCC 1A00383 = DSM 14000]
MKPGLTSLFAISCSFLFVQQAFAQTQTEQPKVESEESIENEQSADETMTVPVVISASRTNSDVKSSPQKVTIITREEIEQQLAITTDSSKVLANLLPAYTPAREKLSGSGETFRGRTPLFMIDGVPQSNPLRPTGRAAHTIDFSMVERIEVIHGANAIHGLGATGGIINYITKRPEAGTFNQHMNLQTTAPTTELNSETDSYKLGYGFNGSLEDVDYLVSATVEDQGLYLDADGDPVGVDNTQGDLMDSRTYDFLSKGTYWIDDDQSIGAEFNFFRSEGKQNYVSVTGDRDAGIATTSEKGTPPGEAPRNQVYTTSLNYENTDFMDMDLKIQAYYQDFEGRFGATESTSFVDSSLAPTGLDQSQASSTKVGSKVTLIKDGLLDDRLKLTTGFDVLRDTTEQALILTNRLYVPETEFFNYAPFLQADFEVLEGLQFHSGIRYEVAELDVPTYQTVASRNGVTVDGGTPSFEETLLNFGITYSPVETVSLFGNYAEGFGMPDVGRVLRGINQTGLDVDTFLNLEPIVTENIELGVRYNNNVWDAEFSVYQTSADLGSRLEQVGDDFFVQREKSRMRGLELSGGYWLNEDNKVGLGYSYIEGKYDSDDNGSLDAKFNGLNVPPNRLIATWSSTWTDNFSTFLQVQHNFSKSFDEADLNFSGYTITDLAATYALPTGKINMAIENLLNEDYVTYYSQAALANDDRYFNGRGRTVTVGYSVDF